MIHWVEQRLVEWGEWVHRARLGDVDGIVLPAYKLVHVRESEFGSKIPLSSDVMEMEAIMGEMKVTKTGLFEVAEWLYVFNVSLLEASRKLNVHENTIYNRRNVLHEHVKNRIVMRNAA